MSEEREARLKTLQNDLEEKRRKLEMINKQKKKLMYDKKPAAASSGLDPGSAIPSPAATSSSISVTNLSHRLQVCKIAPRFFPGTARRTPAPLTAQDRPYLP